MENQRVGSRLASQRIEVRLRPDEKATLTKAAGLQHQKVADLVRDSALERAERVIQEQTTMFVPEQYFQELLAALDTPVTANAALRRAMAAAAGSNSR
jgi:uncharacterized protein (DUF1778 family)